MEKTERSLRAMQSRRVVTSSQQETEKFGEEFAEGLKPGTVVGLVGELGAGKTCFVRGVCRGLDVEDQISSPTFVIINQYQAKFPIYHFDLYRLTIPEEILELGYEEYFYGDGVCLIEWADKIEALMPEDSIEVQIRIGDDEEREIAITCKQQNKLPANN